jgi:hypothetical protein
VITVPFRKVEMLTHFFLNEETDVSITCFGVSEWPALRLGEGEYYASTQRAAINEKTNSVIGSVKGLWPSPFSRCEGRE